MNALPLLEAVALDHRAARLDADIARCQAHLDDGLPEVRKHAREWLTTLRTERQVLCRWQSEVPILHVSAMVCRASHQEPRS